MNYITRDILGINIDGQIKTTTLKSYINKLCLQYGSTLEGRTDFSRYILNTSKLPIYVNKDIILFPTMSLRNYETVLINYCNIQEIYQIKDIVRIVFTNTKLLDVKISLYTIKNQMRKCRKIIEHLM